MTKLPETSTFSDVIDKEDAARTVQVQLPYILALSIFADYLSINSEFIVVTEHDESCADLVWLPPHDGLR